MPPSEQPQMIKVSLYIPCYNCSKYLTKTLESVYAQSLRPAEVIVVDDGSSEDIRPILENFPNTIYIRHNVNKGLAAARNTAIRHASYELIANLDADVIASFAWLKMLYEWIERGFSGAQGKLVELNCKTLPDLWRCTHMKQGEDRLLVNPPVFFGNNGLIKREYLSDGYSELLKTNGEDADMTRKIYAKGGRLIYDPSILVYHQKRDSLTSVAKNYWNWLHPIPYISSFQELTWNIVRCTYFDIRIFAKDLLKERRLVLFDLKLWPLWVRRTIEMYKNRPKGDLALAVSHNSLR